MEARLIIPDLQDSSGDHGFMTGNYRFTGFFAVCHDLIFHRAALRAMVQVMCIMRAMV